MNTFLKAGVVALVVVFAAGCTDLKPLEAQVSALKEELNKHIAETAGTPALAANAAKAAQAAATAAQQAQSKADAAASAAQASQQCCDATNEKIDRLFKKSMSK